MIAHVCNARTIGITFLTALFLFIVSLNPAVAAPPAAPTSSLYHLLQAGVSLAVVIGLIYLIYFGLRRLSQAAPTHKGDRLRVVESRHLGGGRWVYILEVADRILIVGGSNEGLQTLAELPRDEYERQSANNEEHTSYADN